MRAVLCLGLLGTAVAQQKGPVSPEGHPDMPIQQCTKGSGCMTEKTKVTMDMNWRWLHNVKAYNNCLTKAWDKKLCPDPETCSKKCGLEGSDVAHYEKTYAVKTVDKGIELSFPKSPRVYMMDSDDTKYKMFKLKNREFSVDVDLSALPCGMNAAVYFVEMPADGDRDGSLNTAGAKYGTGYCDAQCPHMKFIRGKANMLHWKKHRAQTPEQDWVQVGPEGRYGICCAEMDIVEANRMSGAFTAHPCSHAGQKLCEGDEECGDHDKEIIGYCDKSGCGFNSFRNGDQKFFGPGPDFAVDTSKPMTVVTQFITSDHTDSGDLVEVRQLYVQGGKVIKNSNASLLEGGGDSLTDSVCNAGSAAFNDTTMGFQELGGLKTMGEALGRGMVLTMSIWDDDLGRMLWLDGEMSSTKEDPDDVGVKRGPCPFKGGSDKELQKLNKEKPISVTFKNVRYGEINSTYSATGKPAQGVLGMVSDAGLAAKAGSLREAGAGRPAATAAALASGALLLVAGLAATAQRLVRSREAPLEASLTHRMVASSEFSPE